MHLISYLTISTASHDIAFTRRRSTHAQFIQLFAGIANILKYFNSFNFPFSFCPAIFQQKIPVLVKSVFCAESRIGHGFTAAGWSKIFFGNVIFEKRLVIFKRII